MIRKNLNYSIEKTKAISRITVKKSGGNGYLSNWIYIPTKIVKHDLFQYKNNDKVQIEITKDGKLLISKVDELVKLINEYGLENATLPSVIEKKALENKSRPFLYYKDKVFSYKELNEESNRIAHGIINLLEDIGLRNPKKTIKRQIKISLMLPNCPDFIFSWIGIIKSRCIAVPINPALEGNILKEILIESESEVMIIDYQYFETFKKIKDELPRIKKIFILNAPSKFEFNANVLNYNKINTSNIMNPNLKVKDFYQMEILYTSGTTGKPKPLLFRNYYALTGINVGIELNKIGLDENSIIYCPFPLYHALGQLLGVLPALFYNASIFIPESFTPIKFWKDVKKYEITGFFCFKKFLQQLMDQIPSKTDSNHSVKWVFGFGDLDDIWKSFEKRFGIKIYTSWTLTEAVGITINTIGSKGGKVGSVGKPVSGYEVKVIDSNGNILPPGIGNIGQIVSRSTIPIPLEYYKSKNKSKAENSWFETGDYGYKDKDGFFYYVGRESDMITTHKEIFFAI